MFILRYDERKSRRRWMDMYKTTSYEDKRVRILILRQSNMHGNPHNLIFSKKQGNSSTIINNAPIVPSIR